MKILFLIRTLKPGGAQRQLVNLATGLHQRGHTVSIAVFYPGGSLQKDLDDAGVPVINLDKRHRWNIVFFVLSLLRVVKEVQPDVIHGYDGIPNCLTIVVRVFFRNLKAVWGVRASYLDLSRYDNVAKIGYRIECVLSRFADLIIVNSNAGFAYARSNGFPEVSMKVVFNGIDTDTYKPDHDARVRIRYEWGISEDESLIGLVGRLDAMKDHPLFFKALKQIVGSKDKVRALIMGDGPTQYLESLKQDVNNLGLNNKVLWKSARSDISACMNSFDVLVSSSYGEGFSNVIAEAMASGIPCVVTDVGDSAHIVGDCGYVVPFRDHKALADAILQLLEISPDNKKLIEISARNRIIEHFGYAMLIEKTEYHMKSIN